MKSMGGFLNCLIVWKMARSLLVNWKIEGVEYSFVYHFILLTDEAHLHWGVASLERSKLW